MFRRDEKDVTAVRRLADEKPALFRELLKAGFIYEAKTPSDGYSMVAKGSAKPNFTRFIQGQPYWPDETYETEYQFRNTVLNYRELLSGIGNVSLTDNAYLVEFFLTHDMPIYVRTGEGQYERIIKRAATVVDQLKKATITGNTKIETELTHLQEDVSQFYLMNNPKCAQFINKFQCCFLQQLFLPKEGEVLEIDQATYDKHAVQLRENLEDRTLEKLVLRYQYLHYTFQQINMKGLDNSRAVLRHFLGDKKFLAQHSAITFLTSESIVQYCQRLPLPHKICLNFVDKLNQEDFKGIDFSSVEDLTIFMPDGDDITTFDLSAFPNLTALVLFGQKRLIIKGMTHCRQLKNVRIEGVYLEEEINWQQFTKIENFTGVDLSIKSLDVSTWENLAVLKLAYCPELETLRGFDLGCPIKELTINTIDNHSFSVSLRNLQCIVKLRIPYSNQVVDYQYCKALEFLEFNACSVENANGLFSLCEFPSLKTFRVFAAGFESIFFENGNIENLHIKHEAKLSELIGLGELKKLRVLEVDTVENCTPYINVNNTELVDVDIKKVSSVGLLLSDRKEIKGDQALYQWFPNLLSFKVDINNQPTSELYSLMMNHLLRKLFAVELAKKEHQPVRITKPPSVSSFAFDADFAKEGLQVHVQKYFDQGDPALYRLTVLDQLRYAQGKLYFGSSKPTVSNHWPVPISTGEIRTATRSINLLPGEAIEVPHFTPNDVLKEWSKNTGLSLFYHSTLNQYFLTNLSPHEFTGTVSFDLMVDTHFFQEVLTVEPIWGGEKYMPAEMRAVIDHYFEENSQLNDARSQEFHVFMDKLFKASPLEKINLLKHRFYYEFNDDEEKEPDAKMPQSSDDLIQALHLFKYKKGVCRHRAYLMYILGWYFGFIMRIDRNPMHQFIEILTVEGWKGLNLNGGGNNHYLYQEPVKKPLRNPFREELKKEKKDTDPGDVKDSKRDRGDVKEAKKEKVAERYKLNLFYASAQKLQESTTLAGFVNHLMSHSGNPLIRTAQEEDEKRLDQLFKLECDRQSIPHLYIDNAAELSTLFDGLLVKKEGLSEREGVLKQFIQSSRASLLIINWNHFTDLERSTFKSLCDDPPTLHGIKIKANIKVVGILNQCVEAGDIFSSRCDEFKTPPALALPVEAIPKKEWVVEVKEEVPATDFVLDLYHDPDWNLLLLENLSIKGDAFFLKQSNLLEAMRCGKTILIKNPPFKNKEFQRFWFHLLNEEMLETLEGETIKRHPQCKIYFQKESPIKPLSASVRISVGIPTESKRVHYLNRANFKVYLDRQYIDEKSSIQTLPGIITEIKKDDCMVVIQDNFSADKMRFLTDSIDALKLPFPVEIMVDPRFEKDLVEAQQELPPYIPHEDIKACFIETLDADLLTAELKIPHENIFQLEGLDSWTTLIESVAVRREAKSIKADRKEGLFWEKLNKGETVIIRDGLNINNYKSLQTLFNHPPYLIVNGKRCDVNGKIIWLHKPASHYPVSEAPRYKTHFELKDYLKLLLSKHSRNDEVLRRLFRFIDAIQMPIQYPKLEAIYACLMAYELSDPNTRDDNPIKAILSEHYRHEPELFAYLNVVGKFLFSLKDEKYIRQEKYFALKAALKPGESAEQIYWQLANCLSGAALRDIFKAPPKNVMTNVDKGKILGLLDSNFSPYAPKKRMIQAKQKQRIKLAIQQGKRFVFLLGASGAGKTKVALDLMEEMKCEYHYGEHKIDQWLKEGGYLILDEMNLAKSGHWQWLSGMFANPPSVYYQHATHFLSEKHKIIATGNPLNFPNRHFHQVLYDYAEVVHFKKFKDHELAQVIEEGWHEYHLSGTDQEKKALTDFLIPIYRLLETSTQYPLDMNLRDLKNVLVRIFVLQGRLKNKSLDELARLAVWDEFSNSLITAQAQEQFKDYLQIQDSPITQAFPRDVVVTQVKQPLWQIIYDDLKIAELRLEAKNNDIGKLGILLEGPSGVGKSTLFISVLESLGFSRLAEDTQKRYYQITVGSKNVKELLLKAFEEGSKVILDELNLDPALENILNQLLSGKNLQGKPATKSGFGVYASQNGGKGKVSKALISRFHKLTTKGCARDELIEIATQLKVPDPIEFADNFLQAKKEYPNINERNFFKQAKREAEPLNLPIVQEQAIIPAPSS